MMNEIYGCKYNYYTEKLHQPSSHIIFMKDNTAEMIKWGAFLYFQNELNCVFSMRWDHQYVLKLYISGIKAIRGDTSSSSSANNIQNQQVSEYV